MAGIIAYGSHIPLYRMERATIREAVGWVNPAVNLMGQRSVANYDEDNITMAVNASMECLKGRDLSEIDGVYFASVGLPYRERQNAGIIASALDLKPNVLTADFAGSMKCGTSAVIAAYNAIMAGSAKNMLVCVSDVRVARPGSFQEQAYGDAAVAVLLGESNVIADLKGFYGLSYDFMDRWMMDKDDFERMWEDRWIREEGYFKFIPELVGGVCKRYNLDLKEFSKLCYPCVNPRDHGSLGKALGLEAPQVQENLFERVGDCGAAYPLILLIAALEKAKPKEKICIASFGSGGDALLFETADRVVEIGGNGGSLAGQLENSRVLESYPKFACFRGGIEVEKGIRGRTVPWEQISLAWRSRKELLGLLGVRCTRCGTPQYPRQRVCVNPDCQAIDEMEDYRFSDKRGRLFTYSSDTVVFSLNPPQMYGMIDFEGGGRYWFDITDCELSDLEVNMAMKMTFRRKFVDKENGIYGYCWKAVPERS